MSVKQLTEKRDKLMRKKEELQNALSETRNNLKTTKFLIRGAIADEKNAKIAGKEKKGIA